MATEVCDRRRTHQATNATGHTCATWRRVPEVQRAMPKTRRNQAKGPTFVCDHNHVFRGELALQRGARS